MIKKLNDDSLTESKKRQDAEREIEEIKNGEPKVKEYWDFVRKELDTLNKT